MLDTDHIEALAKKARTDRSAEETALAYQRSLTDVPQGRHRARQPVHCERQGPPDPPFLAGMVFLGITIIISLVCTDGVVYHRPAIVIWIVVLVQVAIAFAAPSTLFGHWKNDRYKERLEWDAFAHFLSDMAMIQKYAPADLSMWGDWLIYGTALGVGKKVEKAMQSLNVRVADTGLPVGAVGMNHAFIPLIAFTPPSHGGPGGRGGLAVAGLAEEEGLAVAVPGEDNHPGPLFFTFRRRAGMARRSLNAII